MLKLIYIYSHVLIVNSHCYGLCYVKKLIPQGTFLKFHTHLEENSERSFQNVFDKSSRVLILVFPKIEFIMSIAIFLGTYPLNDRFNEHRRPVDRPTPSSRPTAVSDHFLSDNRSPNDIELVPLELIHSSRDALRKAREAYLIERGQTLEPKGINKREET